MFSIGIGLLLDQSFNNYVREIELRLVRDTKNWHGLTQPPHITVKRPFQIKSINDLPKAIAAMNKVAKKYSSSKVTYNGYASFGDSVLFLRPNESKYLADLHSDLLNEFEGVFPGCKDAFEGENVIFHSTLAMGLNQKEFVTGENLLKGLSLMPVNAYSVSLGLFVGVDDDNYWAVVNEASLGA